jgi:hypothetical protein
MVSNKIDSVIIKDIDNKTRIIVKQLEGYISGAIRDDFFMMNHDFLNLSQKNSLIEWFFKHKNDVLLYDRHLYAWLTNHAKSELLENKDVDVILEELRYKKIKSDFFLKKSYNGLYTLLKKKDKIVDVYSLNQVCSSSIRFYDDVIEKTSQLSNQVMWFNFNLYGFVKFFNYKDTTINELVLVKNETIRFFHAALSCFEDINNLYKNTSNLDFNKKWYTELDNNSLKIKFARDCSIFFRRYLANYYFFVYDLKAICVNINSVDATSRFLEPDGQFNFCYQEFDLDTQKLVIKRGSISRNNYI